MKSIQFVQVSPEQLQTEITNCIKRQLDDFLEHYKPKREKEYLTRKDVSAMFNVDISTVSNWCKAGKLRPLGIGARVYFLRSEVEQSLLPLND